LFFTRSIFVKLVSWFFLNLLLLGLLLGLFLQAQFYIPPNSSFMRLPDAREVASFRRLLSHELARRPGSDWDDLLRRYGQAFSVKLGLYDGAGRYRAGEVKALPPEVMAELGRYRFPRLMAGIRSGRGRQAGRWSGPGRRIFRLRTRNPTRYWLGFFLPSGLQAGRKVRPQLLVAVADSLFASPLFPNPLPWLGAGVFVLFFSLLWWWPMVRHLTRPLKELDRATEAIARGDFKVELNEKRADEIGRLNRSLNRMAHRLEVLINGQKRFLSDVAHELCAPLARLRMGLSLLERKLQPEQQSSFAEVEEEVEAIGGMVAEVLDFSRADLRQGKVELKRVELVAVVEKLRQRERSGRLERCSSGRLPGWLLLLMASFWQEPWPIWCVTVCVTVAPRRWSLMPDVRVMWF
jgi:two-component system sensor histidine kinase CpxA